MAKLGSGRNSKPHREKRVYRGGGLRPDRAAQKRAETTEREAAWSALSAADKLRELDRRLGAGVGAKRQRARLAKSIGRAA